jgi:hypothetical protein
MRDVMISILILALILAPVESSSAEKGNGWDLLATDSLILTAAITASFASLFLWSLYSSKYEDYRNARDVVEAKRLYRQASAYYTARNAALICSASIWMVEVVRFAKRMKREGDGR